MSRTLVPAEFSRIVRAHDIGSAPRPEQLLANPAERAALARRFDLLALDALTADLSVVRDAGGIRLTGRFAASGEQVCVVSAEPVAFALDEPVALSFSNETAAVGEEIELDDADLDTLPLAGDELDLGEAVAQSLGLALDPYPRAGDEVRAGVQEFLLSEEEIEARAAAAKAQANPFGALRRG